MKFYIGVTDNKWFNFLSMLKPPEVNFWQPGGSHTFRALDTGAPFLFKLKSPLNYIVGGGYFVKHSLIPLSLAWDAFGQQNGSQDLIAFHDLISSYRERIEPDPTIGCIILNEPFFFSREDWIPVPDNWKPGIVQGKGYDTNEPVGAALWNDVQARIEKIKIFTAATSQEQAAAYGSEYLVRARLGQGAFRILVTDAYDRRCAITGERTLPVLQAAHIKPYALSGPHRVSNGFLLRADLHILFDKGYLTITKDLQTEVSRRIKEDFNNGREYYKLHGKKLEVLPVQLENRPSVDFLEWHNQSIYKA